jgi:NAD(P)-dependent dehydrogenase (short-subunit alcohol dehydrogenase family)
MSTLPFPEAFSLRGEIALVTGGGTGIGLAIAQAMVAAEARVVILGRRSAELEAAARSLGERAIPIVHDVNDLGSADGLIGRVTREIGAPTCLVNNAGIHIKKPAVETTTEDFQAILNTHILGAHALTRAVIGGMMARRHGSILFTASMASLFGIPQVVAYAAAKSAMLGLVRSYAVEFSPHGVRVNAIAPGWIETALSRKALASDPSRESRILSRTPLARLGAPEDIGWAAVYLTAAAAKFVSGVVLPVDGGVSIGF